MSGDLDGAEKAYQTAAASGESTSQTHLGLGLIDLDRDQPDAAVTHFKQAAAADPGNIEVLTALGIALAQAGHPAKAATVLVETVSRAPSSVEPRLHLARAFLDLDRSDDALHVLKESAVAFPGSAEVWRLKGGVERRVNQNGEAHTSLTQALVLAPKDTAVLNDLGVLCRALGKYSDAESHYRAALAIDPDASLTHANLGNVLERLNRLDEAEDSLRRAYELNPEAPDTAYNLAAVLTKLERPDEALPLLERIVDNNPDRWDTWTNLGVARMDTGDLDGAEVALRQSLALRPENPEAHYNLAWLLLLGGQHAEGWTELEWRWQLPEFSSLKKSFDCPTWDGEPLGDRTLLVHAEQGFGDAIQFARFIAEIPKENGTVILDCHPPLARLLKGVLGIDRVIPTGESLPRFDTHIPLLSLPKLLAYRGERSAQSSGYLPAQTVTPQTTLPNSSKRKIGLVWAGAPENKIDRRRQVAIENFLPLFEETDADFIGLQVGPRSRDGEIFPAGRLTYSCDGVVADFCDTAAIVGQLDLVIGVDTATIHLSGALGIPTWVLLPYMPDYRWGLGTPETAWYDSMRLFRQPERGNWASVIGDICNALRSW
ncbi:MAG: tetratricopeptide repeat protein [Alphaproteobacteria bacterium]|nr:tetratricopeptide repeat protein [Alphaproteobacteria bacterium]